MVECSVSIAVAVMAAPWGDTSVGRRAEMTVLEKVGLMA